MAKELGFVGLGAMGRGLARRLLAAGHALRGWNRTRSKAEPLVEAGLGWCDSPRAVAERADVFFTMVTDTKALAAVTEGADGILVSGSLSTLEEGKL